MLSWHDVAPGELARAQAKVERLREQLRRAIRARNEIRKAMRVMCVASTAEGKRCYEVDPIPGSEARAEIRNITGG